VPVLLPHSQEDDGENSTAVGGGGGGAANATPVDAGSESSAGDDGSNSASIAGGSIAGGILVVLLIVGIIDLRRRKNAAEAAASPNRGNGLRSRDVAASSNPMYAAVTGIADTLYAIPLEDDGQRGRADTVVMAQATSASTVGPPGKVDSNTNSMVGRA